VREAAVMVVSYLLDLLVSVNAVLVSLRLVHVKPARDMTACDLIVCDPGRYEELAVLTPHILHDVFSPFHTDGMTRRICEVLQAAKRASLHVAREIIEAVKILRSAGAGIRIL
jgi:hypothetical protein